MRKRLLLLTPLVVLVTLSGCVRRVVTVPPDAQGAATAPLPVGMVEVNIISDFDGPVWDVREGASVVCATPCTRRIGASQGLLLTSRRGAAVEFPGLSFEAPGARRALLVAEGSHRGKHVNGIVFTTLGGMGLITAITLTAVGCSNVEKRGGTCTAGLITGGVSLPLTAAALWMLLDSGPKVNVLPVFTALTANGQALATVVVGPTGVAGRF